MRFLLAMQRVSIDGSAWPRIRRARRFSARSAARKIANGIAAGRAEITITPQAFLAARFGNGSPGLKRMEMAGVHLALPDPVEDQAGVHKGEEVRGNNFFLPA